MKCFVAVFLLALFAIAMAEKTAQPEKIDGGKKQDDPRDKRDLIIGGYHTPLTYSYGYGSPYTGYGYGYPYAYSAYPYYRYHPYYYRSPYVYV